MVASILEQSLLNFVYENLVLYASHIGSFAFFLEATSQKDPNKTELPEARTQLDSYSLQMNELNILNMW